MSICVCALCKKPWKGSSSPARCFDCGEISFAIAISTRQAISAAVSASMKRRWQDPEYRAKLSAARERPEYRVKVSAALKRLGQNPEFQTKLSAARKRLWQDPDYQAKMSAAHMRRWLDPEYRVKQSAARIGKSLNCRRRNVRENTCSVGWF